MELVDLLKKNKVVLYSEMVDMQHHVKKKKKKVNLTHKIANKT